MLRARTMPPTCITVRRAASVAAACSTTDPPSATMLPVFASDAFTAATGTRMLSSPEPVGSMSTALPATMAAVPPAATMLPALLTCGAASTT